MPIPFEEVNNFIKEHHCVLLTTKEEYKTIIQKIEIVCKCKKEYITTFESFKRSICKCCRKCGYLERNKRNLEKYGVVNVGELKKYTYGQVKTYYEDNGCVLLTDKYENAHCVLQYKCSCGNTNESRFCDFKNKNARCINCGKDKRKETNLFVLFSDVISASRRT